MQPNVWGPHVWRSIHYIAIGYPEQPTDTQKVDYKEFFTNLWKVIPCQKCSVNYRRHLQELPPIDEFLGSRADLFKWTVGMHNIVNMELGKPQVSLEEAYKIHSTVQQTIAKKDTFHMPNNIVIISLVLVILFLVIFIILEKKNTFR